QTVTAIGRQTLELVRSMSVVVEQELRTRMVALEVLALAPALQHNDITAFRMEAEAVIQQQFPGSNLIVLREDGQTLMNTLLPPAAPLRVRPDMTSARRVFATGQPTVSDFYMGAVGPRPVVAIDVPVKRDDGSVMYVLSTNPRLDDFADIIRRQQLPATWIASIFDRRGVNIARTPNPERFVGQQAGPELLLRVQAAPGGILESTSREGIPLVSAFNPSPRFGWAVAVGVPRAEVIAPALAAATHTLAVGATVLAAALALAVLLARQITGPIA